MAKLKLGNCSVPAEAFLRYADSDKFIQESVASHKQQKPNERKRRYTNELTEAQEKQREEILTRIAAGHRDRSFGEFLPKEQPTQRPPVLYPARLHS
jgi:hypothetical protein